MFAMCSVNIVDVAEIKKRINYINIESMKASIVDGVKVCLNCGKPVPEGNLKYCSQACSTMFWAKHNQAGIRKYVFERDHGVCQMCGYTYPVFRARPIRPVFSKPRPEEHMFSNYTKTNHRIGHYENILICNDRQLQCLGCGKTILSGEECYCNYPKEPNCQFGCPKAVDKYKYAPKNVVCVDAPVKCVECGLKEIMFIEKAWKSDHRKALAKFKKAYADWNREYDAWVKTGIMQKFREEEKQYEHEYEVWKETSEFRRWVADHIIPIALGGPEFELSNVWLLCDKCNKIKTAEDAKKIAEQRRLIREKKLDGKPVRFMQLKDYS